MPSLNDCKQAEQHFRVLRGSTSIYTALCEK